MADGVDRSWAGVHYAVYGAVKFELSETEILLSAAGVRTVDATRSGLCHAAVATLTFLLSLMLKNYGVIRAAAAGSRAAI